jgi:hypothetical protein
MYSNICIYYFPYSGGKFIANCMALSRHVLCNDYDLCKQDLEFDQFDDVYYQFKLESVLSSLDMDFITHRRWKEFGDFNNDLYSKAVAKQRRVVRVAHYTEELRRHQTHYPDIKVCKLVNYNRFNRLCYLLKKPDPESTTHLTSLEYGYWINKSADADIEFDIDDSIDSLAVFLREMRQLYDYLELDDFNADLLTQFYKQYLRCHGLPINP